MLTKLGAAKLGPVRLGFALIWLSFVLYAFIFAPPNQPDTIDLIVKLSSGQWADINPLIVTLFNLMGIWPMIYACLALIDGTGQKISAWPFVTASFAVGAFALLPYLALREASPTFSGHKTTLLNVVDSPWTGRLLALGSLGLLSYGILSGDFSSNWSDFVTQWQTSRFIHVMSLDFCILCAIIAPLLADDMAKRDLHQPALFWTAALIPLFGILYYLSIRPPLKNVNEPLKT
jgi:hypothetical protein